MTTPLTGPLFAGRPPPAPPLPAAPAAVAPRRRRDLAAVGLMVGGVALTEGAALATDLRLGAAVAGVLMLAGGVLAGFTD